MSFIDIYPLKLILLSFFYVDILGGNIVLMQDRADSPEWGLKP